MDINNYVDILNTVIFDYRRENNLNTQGRLVVIIKIEDHETFKAYKKYSCSIIYVIPGIKQSTVSTIDDIQLLTSTEIKEHYEKMFAFKVLRELYNIMDSKYWQSIKEGTYGI